MKKIRQIMKIMLQLDNELSSKSGPFKVKDQIKFTGALYKGESNYEDLYFIVNEICKSSTRGCNTFYSSMTRTSSGLMSYFGEVKRIVFHGKHCPSAFCISTSPIIIFLIHLLQRARKFTCLIHFVE